MTSQTKTTYQYHSVRGIHGSRAHVLVTIEATDGSALSQSDLINALHDAETSFRNGIPVRAEASTETA